MKGPFPAVIQQYISNPKLFDNTKRKFDLRIYVVVFDMEPLTAYIYNEGLVRCCSKDYQAPNVENCKIPHIHLTNSKINPSNSSSSSIEANTQNTNNKKATPAVEWENQVLVDIDDDTINGTLSSIELNKENSNNTTAVDEQSNKFLLTSWLEKPGNVESTSDFWKQVHDSVAATLLAIQPTCALMYNTCFPLSDRRENNVCRSFQTLGFDFIPDADNKLWLLEVNNNPSLNLDTRIDHKIKLPLLENIFNILSQTNKLSRRECVNRDIFKEVTFNETISDNYNMLRMIYTNLCGKYIVKYIIIDTCWEKKINNKHTGTKLTIFIYLVIFRLD